jgi:hypothetical protein
MAREPEADVLTYEVSGSGYGGPFNVVLNGAVLKGVQKIVVDHATQEFTDVVIHIRGTRVLVTPSG